MRFEAGAEASRLLHEMPKPTIALVTGAAVGAGVGLAAACDFRVLSANASFRPGYLRVGLLPDFGTSYYITQIMGSAKARAFFMLADVVDAAARDCGLATDFAETDEDALQRAMTMAERLVSVAPIALQYTKDCINRAETEDLRDLLGFEARCFARCFQSADQKEAVLAIFEKRKPVFQGR